MGTNRYYRLPMILAVMVLLVVSLLLTTPAAAKDTPNHKSRNHNLTEQTIPIYMMMEAGKGFAQEWDGGGRAVHSGVGWMTPFGRASYVAIRSWAGDDAQDIEPEPIAVEYRPEFMDDESWKDMFGGLGLFCIYSLPDGDIYAFDGILANLEPTENDDGRMDYLINVIVGGTGRYKDATGMLFGRTPGRGSGPKALMKIMEGYITVVVKESKYSTKLPSIGMAMNPQVWPEAWDYLEGGYLVPINMEMEAGSDFYDLEAPPVTIHSGVGWLEPFGRAEYIAGVGPGYAELSAEYRPDFMGLESWQNMFGSLSLFCIYSFNDEDSFYAFDGIMGNIQPKVDDDGKMDYLMNIIVGGTGAFEDATGILLGITPGRGAEEEVGDYGISLPDSILKLMNGYVVTPPKEPEPED